MNDEMNSFDVTQHTRAETVEHIRQLKDSIEDAYIEMISVGGAYLALNQDGDGEGFVLEINEFAPEIPSLVMVADVFCDRDIPESIRYIAEHIKNWMQNISETFQRVIDGDYEGVDPATIVLILRDMPYNDYLLTPHWKQIRAGALERAGNRCQVCNTNREQLHVHHRTYENRGEEKPEDVIVLCASCHSTFHKNGRLAK